jgi:hypothetical protein
LEAWKGSIPEKIFGSMNLAYGGNDESSINGTEILSWRNISKKLGTI